MDETELNSLIDAWIAVQDAKSNGPEQEAHWWAMDQVTDWTYDGPYEQLWQFITVAYKRNLSDRAIASLAAGPLEDLLAKQGPEFIERVEELARTDPKFNGLLGGVWRNTITDEIWQRVQKARLHVW